MRLEHHLVGGYVRYISPHIIIIIIIITNISTSYLTFRCQKSVKFSLTKMPERRLKKRSTIEQKSGLTFVYDYTFFQA